MNSVVASSVRIRMATTSQHIIRPIRMESSVQQMIITTTSSENSFAGIKIGLDNNKKEQKL